MKGHSCSRCREADVIPTHQVVKFDTRVQYLCGCCWQQFRSWFNHQPQEQRQLEFWKG